MERNTGYDSILSVIPIGRENAKPMRQVATETGADVRTVRKAIERARIAGEIIASCNSGYFIPDQLPDLRRFYCNHLKRAMTTLATLETTKRVLQSFDVDVDVIGGKREQEGR